MAGSNRKSQAERAASSAKNKKNDSKKAPKAGKSAGTVTNPETKERKDVPVRLITSLLFIGLFVLFLIISFNPEGALIKLIGNVLFGLFGQVGFIVSIPVLLYLFYIHAFSGKRPVRMRTVCLVIFILCCGCISHLVLNPTQLPDGVSLISELYLGGIDCTTAGLICGGLCMIVHWLCGTIISYILFIIAALFLLLGGMQITIPSIVRAIRERPRPDWEPEPKPERQDPATVVVNHFANKRIKAMEQRRQQALSQAEEEEDEEDDEQPDTPTVTKPAPTAKEPKKPENKLDAIMSQIDGDVDEPVSASESTSATPLGPELLPAVEKPSKPVPVREPERKFTVPDVQDAPVPQQPSLEMPPLVLDDPAPKVSAEVVAPPPVEVKVDVKKKKVTAKDAEESAEEVAVEIAQAEVAPKPVYVFPPIDLLKPGNAGSVDGTAEMQENTRRLNEALASFKIEAHIINVTRGPSVTRYEVELEKGVRLNKLTAVADDIALSLGASGVRIAAVPDRISVVGIEVPNRAVTTVSLRDVIDSPEFSKAKSKSSFAVGKDIGGNCIVGNVSKLPHMLIAGTTGSGKSVCMNSIIISTLYKASPDDVKLIMVDPKMVELVAYNGIPHLLIPVVTDPKKAAGSLQWAVTEMMRRYKAMSEAGVRDLESYNSIIETQKPDATRLPQVIVIIDELADLMLVAAKEVEESICRIAQMGRAAGIHLIIATQRPSADVITGLMKANIPSRIAFSVASAMESRIILDTQGAEKLVGKGDMLYAPIGSGKPKRVQGCFVSDQEVEAVTNFVKSSSTSDYDQGVMDEIDRKAAQTGNKTAAATAADPEPTSEESAGDEMLPAAVDVILETGQASVSMLQRRLKLGYARAARIVDEMEEKGIVGPFVGSKPRAILITKEQWESMKNGETKQLDFDDLTESEETDTPEPEDEL